MGLGVAGLGSWVNCKLIIFYNYFMSGEWTNIDDMTIVLETLAGFSFRINCNIC